MKRKTKIILGIILIAVQILSIAGSLKYDEDYSIPLIPQSSSDIFYMIGYWAFGILGVVLLTLGIKTKPEGKSKFNTGTSKNVPTSKDAKIVGDRVIARSQALKRILVSNNCIDFNKVNINSLEYVLFMYDLECYRQVMSLKYSNFYIETIIRTIFNTMEENNRRAGILVSQNVLWDSFKKLSPYLNELFTDTKNKGIDGFYGVAYHLCQVECGMTYEQLKDNEETVSKIVNHFNGIINWPIEYI